MDNQVPNLARNFILSLKMTKLKVLMFPIISYIIGCLRVPEVANIKSGKKNQWFIYQILSLIQYSFYPRWAYSIKNTLIHTGGFQGCWQNSAAFQIGSLSDKRGFKFHQQGFISLTFFCCTYLFIFFLKSLWGGGKEGMW